MSGRDIVIVAGCPRSGTTMMMAMLVAGGMTPHCEPQDYGYGYETDDCKALPEQHAWLAGCAGKCVKLLDMHRWTPPPLYSYRFIWMRRDVNDQVRSFRRFTALAGLRTSVADERALRVSYRRDIVAGKRIARELDPDTLVVDFEAAIADPFSVAGAVADHLGGLDSVRMGMAVHERSPQPLKTPWEATRV